jgi:hypothetical protein
VPRGAVLVVQHGSKCKVDSVGSTNGMRIVRDAERLHSNLMTAVCLPRAPRVVAWGMRLDGRCCAASALRHSGE